MNFLHFSQDFNFKKTQDPLPYLPFYPLKLSKFSQSQWPKSHSPVKKHARPVRVPILPLQNPHTFFLWFFIILYNSGCLQIFKIFRRQRNEIPIRPTKFFLLDVMGNAPYLNILYQLSQSMQDMPHKTSLIPTISLSHHYVFLQ